MLWSRFDDTRLRAVMPGEVSSRSCHHTEALLAACRLGAGPATRPAVMPWLPPRIEWPFGVFHTRDTQAALRACLLLDGTWAMIDAASPLARVRIRALAKLADSAWWRPLHAHDAWDSGVARDPATLAGFTPRRATLIVVEGELDAAGRQAVAALERRAYELPRALRVLLVSSGAVPPFARPI